MGPGVAVSNVTFTGGAESTGSFNFTIQGLDSSTGIRHTARFIGRSMEQADDGNGYTFGIVCRGALAGVITAIVATAVAAQGVMQT